MTEEFDYREKNLSVIERRAFMLPRTLPESVNVDIVHASNGSLTMALNGKLLHSRVDPVAEGRKFADSLKLDAGDHLLLYGFGLAYHIFPIMDIIGPSGKIIVIELNDEIIFRAFSLMDFSSLFEKPNFFLIAGGTGEYIVSRLLMETFSEHWGDVHERRKRVAIHAPSYQFFPAGYEKIKRAFDVRNMEKRFDALLGDYSKSNFRRNRKFVQTSRKAAEIYGNFEGYLGVLAGSGPSLDSVIRYIKYLPEKSFLLAVDSSVKALVRNGIRVDAMISVDPQDAVCRHTGCLPNRDIPLFFVANSNHTLVRSHRGERFFISRGVAGEGVERDMLHSGGAVSCIGLELLIRLGANPIVQIGLDSSFPGSRYYANSISDEMFDEITRLEVLDDIHKRRVEADDTLYLKNFAGGETLSHLNLFSYLRSIETLAGFYGEVEIMVAGTSGASMKLVSPRSIPDIFYRRL